MKDNFHNAVDSSKASWYILTKSEIHFFKICGLEQAI